MEHIQTAKKLGVQKDGELPHVLAYHEAMLLLRAGRYERALETLQPLVGGRRRGREPRSRARHGCAADASEGGAGAKARRRSRRSCCARVAPSVIIWPRSSTRRSAGYGALVQEAPTFPNVHYAYGRFLLATEDLDSGVAEFLEEIEARPEPRPRPHADCRRALPGRFSGRHSVRARSREARARLSVRPLPARPALLRHRRHRAARSPSSKPQPAWSRTRRSSSSRWAMPMREPDAKEEAARARAAFVRLQERRPELDSRSSTSTRHRPRTQAPALDVVLAPRQSETEPGLQLDVRPASPSCASPKCSFRMSAWMFFKLIWLNRL